MPSVLIIEDDGEKLRRVFSCLQEVSGIDRDMIDDARDVNSAKRLLRAKRYDLLILDISVPNRPDELPSHGAGLTLLEEILERDIYQTPVHIVGLTAYQEALDIARPKFEIDSLQVIHYDPTSEQWAQRLKRVGKRVVLNGLGTNNSQEYDLYLGIITALANPELDAVLALPWNWAKHELPNDPTIYHRGWFEKPGQPRREVVAAAAPRMGMQASAVLAAKMAMTFRPKFLAMAGILAGIEGECELGDIIAADPSWDYESGKRGVRDGSPIFAAAPHQITVDPFLRGKLNMLAQDKSAMDEIRRGWSGAPMRNLLSMRLGPVASGAAVLEDPSVVQAIKAQHRKTLGVEMETYGVFVAAEECPLPQPKVFSIKSVCDFADPRKNNDFQPYAAYTSASALRRFVEDYL
jgi:nucleoside phosphorylase/CheY-like chemotaxis protein